MEEVSFSCKCVGCDFVRVRGSTGLAFVWGCGVCVRGGFNRAECVILNKMCLSMPQVQAPTSKHWRGTHELDITHAGASEKGELPI